MALQTLGAERRRGLAAGSPGRRRPGTGAADWPGAERPGRLLGRRPRPVEPRGPTAVRVARATVIDARPLTDEVEAGDWLERIDVAAEAARALAVVNRLIGAYRIAAADPFAHPLPRRAAVAVRAGFGEGQQVADGGWRRAVELVGPDFGRRGRPKSALRPEERLAALLSARAQPLACEELALRARLDLDCDRPLAAALGTRLALEAALVELATTARASGLDQRLAELRDLHDDVIAAANSTLVGPPTASQNRTVADALARIEAVLRARAAAG